MGGFRAASAAGSPESLVVRLRPNARYLAVLAGAALGVADGVTTAGVPGALIAAGTGVVLVLFAYPVVLSTVCRVPVLVADGEGIRFPLMGPRVAWAEVVSVTRGAAGGERVVARPVLLVYTADAQAVICQVRPWLRREARGDLARYGTPLVVPGASLDRSVDDIGAAISQRMPLDGNSVR